MNNPLLRGIINMIYAPIMIMSLCSLYSYAAVDFDVSMQTASYGHVLSAHEPSQLVFEALTTIYQNNNPDSITKDKQLKIPKIIHQIWLGGTLPDEYVPFRKSWITHHPDWLFVFWTNNPLNYNQGQVLIHTFEQLEDYIKNESQASNYVVVDVKQLAFDNRFFYDQAFNYGEKSDILKWEIVYRFGGLYVDTDFECLKPLDDFHYMYDFYTGIQPLDTYMVQLGAALYAAYPGHPILRYCVEEIKNNQHIDQIIVKTGPIHFTRSFFKTFNCWGDDCNVALPASYFYPCSYEQKGLPAHVWQRPESYAVHHWAGSWLKPEGFEKR